MSRHAGGVLIAGDPAEQAREEAVRTFDAGLVPVHVLLGRRGEEREQAARIRAVFHHHVVGVHDVALGFGHGLAVELDHALGEEVFEGFIDRDEADVAHHFAPEARVEQVHDGVGDAADVLVDGEPGVDSGGIEGLFGVLRVDVAEEIPGRVHEGVHGVGLAARGFAAFGAGGVDEGIEAGERRLAAPGELDIAGEDDGQLVVGHGLDAAGGAMDHRNGRAPVALARNAPILEPVGDGGFAEAVLFGVGGHFRAAVLAGEAAPFARVLHDAVAGEGFGGLDGEFAVRGADDGGDRDLVLGAELEVALIVSGNGHDGAGAIAPEDEIADPDGHLGAVEGVDGVVAGEEAFLDEQVGVLAGLVVDHGFEGGGEIAGAELFGEGVFGGEDDAGGAVDGVDAGGEDADFLVRAGEGEIDFGAFAAADPVALHGAHLGGPAGLELVHVVEKLVGVGGDAEEPLVEFALFDGGGFVTPAAAVDDLFIGEDGGAFRAPVDERGLAVGESALVHAQEEPLVPAVILGRTGGDFAVPVVGEA